MTLEYRESLTWLFNIQRFGIKLGLENSRRLFNALDVPQPNVRIIHVAGTNGKGSVCALLDSICRAAGYRTALFTSPHLVSFRERIPVDGELISKDEVVRGLTKIRELVARWEPHPTFFEIATGLALDHFRNLETEIIVLETGMGGRLDATNAVQPSVSVLTPIDYDHQKWLGSSLIEIAREKAGIIKPAVPVVSARQLPEAEAVIRARATECAAPLDFVSNPWSLPVALSGTHQRQNAALALSALNTAEIEVNDNAMARGLATAVWQARFQRWDERTIIDGAHNPAGARILAETWRENFGDQQATIVLAVLKEKDVAGICASLGPIARRWLLPWIRSERALAPAELRLTIQDQVRDTPVAIWPLSRSPGKKRGVTQPLFSSPVHCISQGKLSPFFGASRRHLKNVCSDPGGTLRMYERSPNEPPIHVYLRLARSVDSCGPRFGLRERGRTCEIFRDEIPYPEPAATGSRRFARRRNSPFGRREQFGRIPRHGIGPRRRGQNHYRSRRTQRLRFPNRHPALQNRQGWPLPTYRRRTISGLAERTNRRFHRRQTSRGGLDTCCDATFLRASPSPPFG